MVGLPVFIRSNQQGLQLPRIILLLLLVVILFPSTYSNPYGCKEPARNVVYIYKKCYGEITYIKNTRRDINRFSFVISQMQ
jgi:hypothetical protein